MVQRYNVIPQCDEGGTPRKQKSDDGIYVHYTDYAALLESHQALLSLLSWQRECRGVEFEVTIAPGMYYAKKEIVMSLIVAGETIGKIIDKYEEAIARAEGIG